MTETLFYAHYLLIAKLAARSHIGLCQDITTLELRLVYPAGHARRYSPEERNRHDQLLERLEAYNAAHALLAPATLHAHSLIAM